AVHISTRSAPRPRADLRTAGGAGRDSPAAPLRPAKREATPSARSAQAGGPMPGRRRVVGRGDGKDGGERTENVARARSLRSGGNCDTRAVATGAEHGKAGEGAG